MRYIKGPDDLLFIKMQSGQERKLGALRLPQLRLDFEFSGYSQDAVNDFLLEFARVYHRGGG